MSGAKAGPNGLRVHGADLALGTRTLVRELRLELLPRQCWALIGANGSGKSSLLRALAGFRRDWLSQVTLDGQALQGFERAELARRRGWLAQERADVFGLSVMQTVLLARHARASTSIWESAADIAAAEAALQLLDVAPLAARDVRTLSGGERQRVALAALWAQECGLLLLDEPANHLDLPHQLLLMKLLREHCHAGRSAMVVVHDINLAQRCATHALLLLPGGGWHAGPLTEVMTAERLHSCLSCSLQRIEHQGQTLWLPCAD